MLLAFIHLHSNKKVHRDIKPGNVLVNQHGEVKIADFGISSRLSNDDEFCRTFVGTQLYMSPERIDSQAYSYPGDIWSFGLTLMYCALGRTPISSEGGYWYVTFPSSPYVMHSLRNAFLFNNLVVLPFLF